MAEKLQEYLAINNDLYEYLRVNQIHAFALHYIYNSVLINTFDMKKLLFLIGSALLILSSCTTTRVVHVYDDAYPSSKKTTVIVADNNDNVVSDNVVTDDVVVDNEEGVYDNYADENTTVYTDDNTIVIDNDTDSDVDVYVILDEDTDIRAVSKEIQTEITRAISKMVGMEVGRINVHIEDMDYKDWHTEAESD